MVSPALALAPSLVPFACIAIAMVAMNVVLLLFLLPRHGRKPTLSRSLLAGLVLASSTIFWAALVSALLGPTLDAWILVIQAMMVPMTAPFLWLLSVFYRADRRTVRGDGPYWPLVISLSVGGSEVLMGAAFLLLQGGSSLLTPVGGGLGWALAFARSTTSPWFYWPMLATMVPVLLWVDLPRVEKRLLLGLAATAAGGPWVPIAPLLGTVLMAIPMTATVILVLEQLGSRAGVSRSFLRTSIGVLAAFAAMAAAQLYLIAAGTDLTAILPFAVVSTIGMVGELAFLVHRVLRAPSPADSEETLWIRSPVATTSLLALIFGGEWCMSAALGLATGAFPSFASVSPLAWSLSGVGSTFAAGVVDLAAVTATPFFLGLMGIEMGALVVGRLRRPTESAQRARLGLALGAYTMYTIAGPAFVGGWSRLPGTWPNVGAFGPVGSPYLLAILGSYGIIAGVVLLFGRRAYCSVLCPSAVMYGGEFSQRLIPTIAERPIPRHHVLGVRWRHVPLLFASAAWVLMAVAILGSVGDSYLGWNLTVAGVDPAIFYAGAVWNFLWYLAFVAIPYVGMSPCRTWGFCTTGTLLGVVSWLGMYRKEALDQEICRICPTHDCGRACEVGLAEMPVALARTGRFRSVRCVGSHDCEVACPYGNLVSRDARDAVRRWVGLPDRFAGRLPRSPIPRLPSPALRVPAPLSADPRSLPSAAAESG